MKSKNPLSDLITDETYSLLSTYGLLNQKSVRNHMIRKKFRNLKEENNSVIQAIEILMKDYPYLHYDTIRKIVYNIQN